MAPTVYRGLEMRWRTSMGYIPQSRAHFMSLSSGCPDNSTTAYADLDASQDAIHFFTGEDPFRDEGRRREL